MCPERGAIFQFRSIVFKISRSRKFDLKVFHMHAVYKLNKLMYVCARARACMRVCVHVWMGAHVCGCVRVTSRLAL